MHGVLWLIVVLVVVFAFLACIETFAVTSAVMLSVHQVGMKTAAIMVSLIVGGVLLIVTLIELFPSNLESQIEAELTQGLKSKD